MQDTLRIISLANLLHHNLSPDRDRDRLLSISTYAKVLMRNKLPKPVKLRPCGAQLYGL
ncbi:hypothetical protein [Pseudanabaena sp. 'Roaring Creek']|uniref:hypothetical protein n=1 Tax=Pseudanabaena sp. 'Roaring Creek' TaxID=1681830 RepID=UPI000ACB441D|nr:hypothetical protein [Pseudanabaena sp. 'Roaring Creek']